MHVVVAYDITDDRRRARLFKRLKDFGTPVQFSVFECDLSQKEIGELRLAVRATIKPRKRDCVNFYYLCKSCSAKTQTMPKLADSRLVRIIGLPEEDPLAASSFGEVGEYSLMAQVCDADNLRNAWKEVNGNRGCAGADRVTLEKFGTNVSKNLAALQEDMLTGRYRPAPVLRRFIPKPDGGQRPLGIPTVRDRIAQEAVYLILCPIWDPEMADTSFAYRPGRSVGKAIKAIEALHTKGFEWVVDADIEDYFERIDHRMLGAMVADKIKDKHILGLIDLWLKAQVFDGRHLTPRLLGVPQGGVISPLLSNVYLDYLDKKLLDEHYHIVRYADDFVILCNNKATAQTALKRTDEILSELKLRLKKEKTRITNFKQGFQFLGNVLVGGMRIPVKKLKQSRVRWSLRGQDINDREF